MDLQQSMMISAAGLRAQSVRMRVIAENIANQDSIATGPGDQPYARKILTFRNELDRATGITTVVAGRIELDRSSFDTRYEPGHPAADDKGYVTTTNVNGIIEMMDMQQAQRSYQANLNAIEASRNMLMQTVEILR